ncbi:hypothetical protein G5C65_20685 [Streptomyces sp. SB3404]|uniref:SAV-6107-like HEPN domain-containing protein n=1 Tax=Streptomyces boncukensis TaxID=2711219 RepID=A0A6G4X0E6_9ACTN|nr:hypothetical protein [Streptomyces boncukensis]
MEWFLGPVVALLTTFAAYGAWRLYGDARERRRGPVARQPASPEQILLDAYRQALRAAGDNAWLATDDAGSGQLVDLQARWEKVRKRVSPTEQPPTAHSVRAHLRVTQERHEVLKRASVPPSTLDLLSQARSGLADASTIEDPNSRYAAAHLAALRTAAAVLATRGQPEKISRRRRSGIRSAWALLPEVAPELADWSALFAAGASLRARAEAGIENAATQRDADTIMRDATTFLLIVERMLVAPNPHQPTSIDLIELTENRDANAAVRHLAEGFDDLFRALGPPPPGLKQKQTVVDGGGGTVR